jgi:SAM-dependent methyltransferase
MGCVREPDATTGDPTVTSTSTLAPPDRPTPDLEAVADRLLSDTVTTLELLTVHLGLELGLYATLHRAGPATAGELAERAAVAPRYAREWLEQQTVAGYLTCEDPTAEPDDRRFALPPALATVLLDEEGGAFLGPLVGMVRGSVDVLERLLEAYRTGAGVPYEAYGPHIRHGIGRLNGATFDAALAAWLEALPDVHDRLVGAPDPRVLDLGCGTGRSAIAIARAYPRVTVHGVDLDAASVAEARAAAADAGVADRVTFTVGDASVSREGRYQLVTIFEALHDTGDPVGVLRAARSALDVGGAVLVTDERVADRFGDSDDVVERLQYGFRVLHCLPATLAEDPVVANGTVLRQPTVRRWAAEAGLTLTELAVDDPFWRHYRMDAVAR